MVRESSARDKALNETRVKKLYTTGPVTFNVKKVFLFCLNIFIYFYKIQLPSYLLLAQQNVFLCYAFMLVLTQPIFTQIGVLNVIIIEIGLERAPFVVFVNFFSSFEHVKNLLIMGPNNTKTHRKV